MQNRIYLAGPYSDPDKGVRSYRFAHLTAYAAEIMRQGALVYSPITHGHTLGAFGSLGGTWETWGAHCLSFIETWATHLYVVRLAGWESSQGVKAEIAAAQRLRLPVVHILPMEKLHAHLTVYGHLHKEA